MFESDDQCFGRYSMAVIAIDGGIPPKSGSLVVDVVVTDFRRSVSHRFENDSYETVIVENSPPGTTVIVVRAMTSSRHLSTGGGSSTPILSYGFTEQTELLHGRTFGIRNTTGEIFLKEALDYEVASLYQVTVTAMATVVNSGQQQQQQTTTFSRVTIHVQDENDNAPQLTVNTGGECSSRSECIVQVRKISTF